MLQSNIVLYIAVLTAIVVGAVIIKKITSCFVKSIILLLVIAALAVYFYLATS